MAKNEVYVTTDLNDEALWRSQVTLGDVHWIGQQPDAGAYQVRIRHRAPLVAATISYAPDGQLLVSLSDEQRAVASGQSMVIYNAAICLGGGIVTA